MSIVVEVIAEYLQSNRRLVIPAFGAFMVKESGERVFSDLLNTDDGVLASLLGKRGLTEMEVAVTMDRFIFEVRHELEQYGYCRLGELGTLRIEPATKTLKLYPQVQGELPKQTPYIPKPVSETENGTDERNESRGQTCLHYAEQGGKAHEVGLKRETGNEVQETIAPTTSTTPTTPIAPKTNAPKKPRKKFDFVMVVAVVILLVALVVIGYGWYVSNLSMTDDDAAMEALRVTPGQIVNE